MFLRAVKYLALIVISGVVCGAFFAFLPEILERRIPPKHQQTQQELIEEDTPEKKLRRFWIAGGIGATIALWHVVQVMRGRRDF